MSQPEALAHGEVAEFLENRRSRFLKTLQVLRRLLEDYKSTPEGHNVIHSVYSRGDRQPGGDELKQAWQVREKVLRERMAGNSAYSAHDVHDIVGLTVVCPFPDSAKQVGAFLEKAKTEGKITIVEQEMKDTRIDYQADHYTVTVSDPDCAGIKCEIQVKTILFEAWSYWTHDISYKPKDLLPIEAEVIFESVSARLSRAESDAQVARDRADHLAQWVERLREPIRHFYAREVARVVGESLPEGDDQDRARRLQTALESDQPLTKDEAADFIDWADRLRQIDLKSACKALQVLPYACIEADLRQRSADRFDRWVEEAADTRDKITVLSYQDVALLHFNWLPEAIGRAELGLQLATKHMESLAEGERPDFVDGLVRAHMNVAHHLAELGPRDRSDSTDIRAERARELVSKAKTLSNGPLGAYRNDTAGWVKIKFGRTADEIKEGRELCEAARQTVALRNPLR